MRRRVKSDDDSIHVPVALPSFLFSSLLYSIVVVIVVVVILLPIAVRLIAYARHRHRR